MTLDIRARGPLLQFGQDHILDCGPWLGPRAACGICRSPVQ